jgi:hypothetical protein
MIKLFQNFTRNPTYTKLKRRGNPKIIYRSDFYRFQIRRTVETRSHNKIPYSLQKRFYPNPDQLSNGRENYIKNSRAIIRRLNATTKQNLRLRQKLTNQPAED